MFPLRIAEERAHLSGYAAPVAEAAEAKEATTGIETV
jgi:hypothetical protein